ncbi:hypothetical protein J6590_094357 [Homalodisca vitripennis]|nr:hypothetical protein J6590_046973 [Homalodisca vitripennis]KAG8334267.1 hypothetical protein J6590_094357 [Homalodisca vitripennis]
MLAAYSLLEGGRILAPHSVRRRQNAGSPFSQTAAECWLPFGQPVAEAECVGSPISQTAAECWLPILSDGVRMLAPHSLRRHGGRMLAPHSLRRRQNVGSPFSQTAAECWLYIRSVGDSRLHTWPACRLCNALPDDIRSIKGRTCFRARVEDLLLGGTEGVRGGDACDPREVRFIQPGEVVTFRFSPRLNPFLKLETTLAHLST